MKDSVSELCEISEKSYYVWKNKSHSKLISFLEKYYNENEIKEYNKFERIIKKDIYFFEEYINKFYKLEESLFSEADALPKYNLYQLLFFIFTNIEKENSLNLIEDFTKKNNISFWDLDYYILEHCKDVFNIYDNTSSVETLNLINLQNNDFIDLVYSNYINTDEKLSQSIRICVAYNIFKYYDEIDPQNTYFYISNICNDICSEIKYIKKRYSNDVYEFKVDKFNDLVKSIQRKEIKF